MNFPGYSASNIIVGGRAAVEELWIVLQCQYYLDLLSSGDTDAFDLQKVTTMLRGQCHCPIPSDPQGCKPVHRRIGQLLGYSDKEVDDFVSNMAGYNHMPDVEYPFELPPSLANVPKNQGKIISAQKLRNIKSYAIFNEIQNFLRTHFFK